MKKYTTYKQPVKHTSSYINNRKAWLYFEQHGFKNHKGLVLHHKDVNLKKQNPERYAEWNIDDLEIMTKAEHRALHMQLQTNGKSHTKLHNKRISKGMREYATKGKMIKIHIAPRAEETLYFQTLADAARYIGCTRQLVSQCLRHTNNKRACGYEISIIDATEITDIEK